jgi:Protein of unknown function (DUF3168)
MSASPTVPLRIAVDTVLQTSSFFAGDKLYLEGSVPRTAALPYVVLGTGTEVPLDTYNGQYRHEATAQLKTWGQDKDQAELGYAELKSKLDNTLLTVTGHGTGKARITKIADLAEPDPEIGGHQVVALLRIRLQAA